MNKLYLLPADMKKFLISFVSVLTIGVLIGLTYLYYTTNYSPQDTIERFNGSVQEYNNDADEFDIQENYPRPVSELLVTTHNHVISFSLIFAALGFIFYLNSIINGPWKKFFLVEPFISILLSFGGIWLMRFVNENFIYLTVISSAVLYISFFIMSAVVLFELIFKSASSAKT